jgi:hypothetical protein
MILIVVFDIPREKRDAETPIEISGMATALSSPRFIFMPMTAGQRWRTRANLNERVVTYSLGPGRTARWFKTVVTTEQEANMNLADANTASGKTIRDAELVQLSLQAFGGLPRHPVGERQGRLSNLHHHWNARLLTSCQ